MRVEHGGVQQQLALAIKEERWLEAAHFCEVISRSGDEQSDVISPPVQEQMPQRLPPRIKIEHQLTDAQILPITRAHLPQLRVKSESRSPTQYSYSAGIPEDTLRTAQMAHAFDNPQMPSLPIQRDPSTDITVDMQAILMERFGVEIQLHNPVIGRVYLVPANWHVDEAFDRYMSDMDQRRYRRGCACLAPGTCGTDTRIQ
jgi:hypothetical protein